MQINNYVWENDLSLNDLVLKQKERIEYLERSNNRREDEILELRQENADLDNIINELEKELKDMATLKTDKYGNTRKITHIDINWLLLKIKELKGDGSNEL